MEEDGEHAYVSDTSWPCQAHASERVRVRKTDATTTTCVKSCNITFVFPWFFVL